MKSRAFAAASAGLKRLSPICTVADIRAIEAHAFAGTPRPPLMARAGSAAAACARALLGERTRVLVLAGPGNNGGDAFVAARELRESWLDVEVVFTGTADRLPADALDAFERWRAVGGTTVPSLPPDRSWDLVIDGLFGIGLERDVTGAHAALIDQVNALDSRALALDIPSGLHADSGRVLGTAIRAHATITFIARKAGLHTLDGPDHAGRVHVDALGLDGAAIASASGHLLDESVLRWVLAPRALNSHKGTYGNTVVLGGATGMTGAALLAGRAALRLGAGRVFVGFCGTDAPSLDPILPELMLRRGADAIELADATCIVVGPGMGTSVEAAALLDRALGHDVPLVLDADALNLVAADPARRARMVARSAATIVTPHPAEAARLLSITTPEVQRDRVVSACELAKRLNAAVVLKGSGSVCALADGSWYLNPTGNPGMATAGMGDTLAGMVGALVSQGASPDMALLAGVYLHGLAGDEVAAEREGPLGVTASAVAETAPRLLNRAAPWMGFTH